VSPRVYRRSSGPSPGEFEEPAARRKDKDLLPRAVEAARRPFASMTSCLACESPGSCYIRARVLLFSFSGSFSTWPTWILWRGSPVPRARARVKWLLRRALVPNAVRRRSALRREKLTSRRNEVSHSIPPNTGPRHSGCLRKRCINFIRCFRIPRCLREARYNERRESFDPLPLLIRSLSLFLFLSYATIIMA